MHASTKRLYMRMRENAQPAINDQECIAAHYMLAGDNKDGTPATGLSAHPNQPFLQHTTGACLRIKLLQRQMLA